MTDHLQFYIDGAWVDPCHRSASAEVINPATEKSLGRIAMGTAADVDKAVAAARVAFDSWSVASREERLSLLERVAAEYKRRADDVAAAITAEMGCPAWLSRNAQAAIGIAHLETAIAILRDYSCAEKRGSTVILKEPIGVCGLITPWNWPMNQIVCKVAPALAVGCTIILKPSEIAPLSAIIFAEILDAAGLPNGVFNLINGSGAIVGEAISAHPGVDMVSITGSTRAGVAVAKAAADTIKRVHQELGGKSPNIILPDADLEKAVSAGVKAMLINSGQSCNAPSRMLVPKAQMDTAARAAKETAEAIVVGAPETDAYMGPVSSEAQWTRIQELIDEGISEGARLVTGGTGRPASLATGYYLRPTIFADVTNDMTIAREEIFGPVLVMLGYESIDEAIAIANDTPYGLAAYVEGHDENIINDVVGRLKAGQVSVNGAGPDIMAPFGGYKQSGNGREWGDYAFAEFLEIKSVIGLGT